MKSLSNATATPAITAPEVLTRTMRALGVALEVRGLEPPGHADRVSTLAVGIARELGLNAQEVWAVQLGAYLHDIGKFGVPLEVLHKSLALSESDWAWIRAHPNMGCALVAGGQPLPPQTLELIQSHHERWDGQGYPHGLRELEIPFSARIFAVVDAFITMTAERWNGRSVSPTAALLELWLERGRAYDARVVDALYRVQRFVAPDIHQFRANEERVAIGRTAAAKLPAPATPELCFALLDARGRTLYLSPTMLERSQLTLTDPPLALMREVHPDDRQAFLSALQPVQRDELRSASINLRWRSGSNGWREASLGLFHIPDDSITDTATRGSLLVWLEFGMATLGNLAALTETTSLFNTIMNSSVALLLTNAEERIVDVSPAFLHGTGYTRSEVLGRTPRFLQGPKTDRVALDTLRHGIDAGVSCQAELLNYRKDGSELWVQITVDPIRDVNGRIAYFVAVQSDITISKRRQLDDQRLLEVTQEAVVVTDVNGRVQRSNLAGLAALNSPSDTLGDQPIWTHLRDSDQTVIQEALAFLKTHPQPFQLETSLRSGLEALRFFGWSVTPHIPDGSLYWVGRDITELRNTAQQLRLERDFATSVIDNAGSLVLVLDSDERIVRFNLAAEQAVGARFAEVSGQTLERALRLDTAQTKRFKDLLVRARRGVHRSVLLFPFHPKGKEHFVSWSASAVSGENGANPFIVLIGQDITERIENVARYRELFQSSEQQRQQLQLLLRIADSVARELDLPGMARALVHVVSSSLHFQHVSIYYLRDGALHLEAQSGYETLPASLSSTEGAVGQVMRDRQPLWLPKISPQAGADAVLSSNAKSAMVIPLGYTGQVIGVLMIEGLLNPLTATDYQSLSGVISQLELSLERAALHAESQKRAYQYRVLVENINDAIMQINAAGQVLYVNPAWTHISGHSASVTTSNPAPLEFLDTGSRTLLRHHLRRLIAAHASSIRFEGRIVTGAGWLRWVAASGRLTYHEGGFSGATLVLSDITDGKVGQVSRYLRQGRERFYRFEDLQMALSALVEFLGAVSAAIHFADNSTIESLSDRLALPLESDQGFVAALTLQDHSSAATLRVRWEDTDSDEARRVTLASFRDDFAAAVERAQAHRALIAAEQSSREFIEVTLRAQEEERERIAMDLHDGPAQTMVSAMRFIESSLEDETQLSAHRHAKRGLQLISQSIKQVRDTINDLIPPDLEILGLRETLRQRLEAVAREENWSITFDWDSVHLNTETKITLYRIFVEALNNVRHHARAGEVRCTLKKARQHAVLEITDDGIGFTPQDVAVRKSLTRGIGTISMRKRAELIACDLSILSQPGSGTTVRVIIPKERISYANN
jgi:PAS domain S-box-containing protein